MKLTIWRIAHALVIVLLRVAPCLHNDCSGVGGAKHSQCKRCAALEEIEEI